MGNTLRLFLEQSEKSGVEPTLAGIELKDGMTVWFLNKILILVQLYFYKEV